MHLQANFLKGRDLLPRIRAFLGKFELEGFR